MKSPPKDHTDLWNSLPYEERHRLMPYMIESQILHICQCKQKAINAHNRHMSELDSQMKNLADDLKKFKEPS